jgi:hypothetical protein
MRALGHDGPPIAQARPSCIMIEAAVDIESAKGRTRQHQPGHAASRRGAAVCNIEWLVIHTVRARFQHALRSACRLYALDITAV